MDTIQPLLLIDGGGGDGGGGGGGNPCLVSGTRIATSEGSVSVENLSVGAMVVTASGESRPVRWLGHRELDCNRYPDPAVVWPICVKAGAFAENQPSRDLWVSPGHAIFVDGVLIQAERLVNGATIMQVPRAHVEYWHVELDRHDILFAEGLATESYLDTGNRTAFVNGGAYLEAYPDFKPKHSADTCVPLVFEGPALQSAKAALLARAQALGHAMTEDAEVHVLADGERIEPLRLSLTRLAFTLPAGRSTIELRSRSFIPANMEPASDDRRSLGICVHRMQVDGGDIALEDDAVFALGWHKLECDAAGGRWRWSSERAPLPTGTRLVVIDYSSKGPYWAERPSQLVAVSA
jgi:hypothetical protein